MSPPSKGVHLLGIVAISLPSYQYHMGHIAYYASQTQCAVIVQKHTLEYGKINIGINMLKWKTGVMQCRYSLHQHTYHVLPVLND